MSINTPENQDRVAAEFVKILTVWFKEDKKLALTADLVEHANDHFDANMAMDEAFTKCGFKALPDEDEGMSQEATDLWNESWTKAVKLAV